MYHYDICTEPDHEIFWKQCCALESRIPDLEKGNLLEDVDGSETQLYKLRGMNVSVHNSHYIGAVYVKSDIDLIPYF